MTRPQDTAARCLRIDVSQDAAEAWIQIHGEVDPVNHRHLQDILFALEFLTADKICLDLRSLTICDPTGCQHLLDFIQRAHSTGRDACILGPTSSVMRTLIVLAPDDIPTFL